MRCSQVLRSVKLKQRGISGNRDNSIHNNQQNENIHKSIDKYTRMVQLNNHIQEQFRKKLKEIKGFNAKDTKKSSEKK